MGAQLQAEVGTVLRYCGNKRALPYKPHKARCVCKLKRKRKLSNRKLMEKESEAPIAGKGGVFGPSLAMAVGLIGISRSAKRSERCYIWSDNWRGV